MALRVLPKPIFKFDKSKVGFVYKMYNPTSCLWIDGYWDGHSFRRFANHTTIHPSYYFRIPHRPLTPRVMYTPATPTSRGEVSSSWNDPELEDADA